MFLKPLHKYILFFVTLLGVGLTSCHHDKSSDNPPCPEMVLNVSADTSVVAGDTISLLATLFTGATYTWTGPNGFVATNYNPVIYQSSSLNQGYYYASADIQGLCQSNVDSFYVTVLCDRPEDVMANYNSPVAVGNTIHLYAASLTDSVQYIWYGPSGFTSNLQNPVIPATTYGNEGVYVVYAYKNNCYSKPDSVTIKFNQCHPSKNSFVNTLGQNYFLYSYGAASLYPNTHSITGTGWGGAFNLRATFYSVNPPPGVYTINPAHCPASGSGPLTAGEVCVEFTDSIGVYQGVSGSVKLTNANTFEFCSAPFRLQYTTTTLFSASGKVQF
ncbi:MAG: hypothetical protein JSS90_01495 [Bacteroidetes bacterium]|jgi:hypothetical protein|nr:hypothetical protein [Bacteroidota bacterium]